MSLSSSSPLAQAPDFSSSSSLPLAVGRGETLEWTLGELAKLVEGSLEGAADLLIRGAAIVRDVAEGELTFATDSKRLAVALESPAAAVVVPLALEPNDSGAAGTESAGKPLLRVADVVEAFAQIVGRFRRRSEHRVVGVSALAAVSSTARLGAGVSIAAGSTIGDDVEIGPNCTIHSGVQVMAGCRIGRDSVLFPGVVLYEDTRVGERCLLHAGCVIGAHGFGYRLSGGRHRLTHQLGYVELHDDVEIGANSTVDRGTFGPTVIGAGTKIDNLVQVGHNCRIGKHNLLCSQVGIAGSTTTGDYVVMGGQVGVRDHLAIGDRVQIGAQSGIAHDLPAGEKVLGSPAKPEREMIQELMALGRLPKMRLQLRALERQVARLVSEAEQAAAGAAQDDKSLTPSADVEDAYHGA